MMFVRLRLGSILRTSGVTVLLVVLTACAGKNDLTKATNILFVQAPELPPITTSNDQRVKVGRIEIEAPTAGTGLHLVLYRYQSQYGFAPTTRIDYNLKEDIKPILGEAMTRFLEISTESPLVAEIKLRQNFTTQPTSNGLTSGWEIHSTMFLDVSIHDEKGTYFGRLYHGASEDSSTNFLVQYPKESAMSSALQTSFDDLLKTISSEPFKLAATPKPN